MNRGIQKLLSNGNKKKREEKKAMGPSGIAKNLQSRMRSS